MLNKMMGNPNEPDALRRRLLAAMLVAPWFSPFATRAPRWIASASWRWNGCR